MRRREFLQLACSAAGSLIVRRSLAGGFLDVTKVIVQAHAHVPVK
jgi:hypothetical protein